MMENKVFSISKIIEKLQTADSIVIKTIYEYLSRAEVGLKKYGCSLDRTDLNHGDYIQHLKEELQDAVLYLNKYQNMKYDIENQIVP